MLNDARILIPLIFIATNNNCKINLYQIIFDYEPQASHTAVPTEGTRTVQIKDRIAFSVLGHSIGYTYTRTPFDLGLHSLCSGASRPAGS